MEEINLDSLDLNPSVDFGGGIELLMNDKKAKNQNQTSISKESISFNSSSNEIEF